MLTNLKKIRNCAQAWFYMRLLYVAIINGQEHFCAQDYFVFALPAKASLVYVEHKFICG